MKTRYINGREELGIAYNWNLIEKEYLKLGIPSQYFKPPFSELHAHKYFINLSERRTGKTTNWLLLGMIMNKLYDTRIIYVRQTRDMIAPKYSNEIFNVITEWNNGEYIKRITGDVYNSIKYDTRKYYYCRRNEDGEIVSRAELPFMHCVSIDDGMDLKSTFNVPTGDLVLFDEFIGKRYAYNEAIQFFDLCSTIIRGRLSPIIVMLANTINLHSEYFYELDIAREVKNLSYGDRKSITTDRGTKILVEVIKIKDSKEVEERRRHNSLFFGFKNPKLTSITGGEEIWAYEQVPHITKYDKDGEKLDKIEVNYKGYYIKAYDELIKLTFMYNEKLGKFLEVTRATRVKSNSTIFVQRSQELLYNNEYKNLKVGSRIYSTIMRYVAHGKIYFQNNEIGNIFYDYLESIKE